MANSSKLLMSRKLGGFPAGWLWVMIPPDKDVSSTATSPAFRLFRRSRSFPSAPHTAAFSTLSLAMRFSYSSSGFSTHAGASFNWPCVERPSFERTRRSHSSSPASNSTSKPKRLLRSGWRKGAWRRLGGSSGFMRRRKWAHLALCRHGFRDSGSERVSLLVSPFETVF